MARWAAFAFAVGLPWLGTVYARPAHAQESTPVMSEEAVERGAFGREVSARIDVERIREVLRETTAANKGTVRRPPELTPIPKRPSPSAPGEEPEDIEEPAADPPTLRQAQSEGGGAGVSSNAVALPGGASSVTGLGESFTTQLSTGIMSFSVPIKLPAARGGVQPRLDLSYSSGGGFGIAGTGWNVGSSAISRQTDRGIPRYDDRAEWHPEQDRFLFGGMELIPMCTVEGTTCSATAAAGTGEVMPAWANGWQHFRARIEGGYLRFFWSPDHQTWRVYSKEGSTFEFGIPLDGTGYRDALQVNPDRPAEVHRWYLVRQYDSQGGVHSQSAPQPVNVIQYRYAQDGGAVYLTDIYDTPPALEPQTENLALYAHHAALIYEERSDPVVAYRSGWLVEHALRLSHVDVTSKPFAGGTGMPRELVRRYHLAYDAESHASLLVSVQLEGRCSETITEGADGLLPPTSCPRMPAVALEYQRSLGTGFGLSDSRGRRFEPFDDTVRKLPQSPPHSLDEALVGLMDVNSDGLPDVIATAPGLYGGRHAVFFNGDGGFKRFGVAKQMGVIPLGDTDAGVLKLSSPNVTALDLDANGVADLVHMPQKKSYSIWSAKKEGADWWWQGRQITTASGQDVKIDFTRDARNVQVMDVNGDGLVDIVYSSPTEYQTFFSLGRFPNGDGQFGHAAMTGPDRATISNDPVRHCAPWSAQTVRFSDPDVRVSDMNGDGLADIVRVRSGQILYWPGRGNGYWGTGLRDECPAGSPAGGRHIEMLDAPRFGITDPGTLLLSDVNADGFADVVEVRNDTVDVYLNDNGQGWTGRHAIEGTPIRPPTSNYVRLTDIDGSGSPDILWGEAYNYRYIDLTGGVIPHMLVKVHNGLGGTTEFKYETTTDVMRAADAAGQGWDERAPTVTPLIVQSTIRDNLERIGRPAGVYITQYAYQDAVFEGRGREFRGFREARVKVLGDSNSPTSTQRSVFLLGECVNDATEERCDPVEAWRDNWRDALKGLPVLSEAFDDVQVGEHPSQTTYLSTEHTQYHLKQLYAGLDGRRVIVALPIAKDAFLYDTANFDPDGDGVSMPEVKVSVPGVSTDEDGLDLVFGWRTVPRRAETGTARIRSTSVFDVFGNMTQSVRSGCTEGCPNGVDEVITATSEFNRPAGDASGWAFRETRSYVTGSVTTAARHETLNTYNAVGKLLTSKAVLSGTLALQRFHTPTGPTLAPAPPGASGGTSTPVQITIIENTYDGFGRVVFAKGPNGRCSSSESDPEYEQIPIRSSVFVGAAGGSGCGTTEIADEVIDFDRGLEAPLLVEDAHGQPAQVVYDGFGRVVQLRGPNPDSPGTLAEEAALTATYTLPTDPLAMPYSLVVVRSQDGADVNTDSYHESQSFSDGLGRTMASLSQTGGAAEHEPGDWIVGGATIYNTKGGVERQHLPWFHTGPPEEFDLADPPPSNYTSARYDAFGRVIYTYGLDQAIAQQTKHHALSQDVYDNADLAGPRANTFVTVVSDGHGRGVQRTVRLRVGVPIEQRHVLNDYLPTGELRRVIQRRTGSTDVVRWFRYDSIGRMVANVEPNTSGSFNVNPAANINSIKAFRYAYNDAGDLVGTSDGRGCGVNYHYDTGGRLLAENRSPCLPHHAAYTAPNLSTGDGTEAFYRYDTADPENASVIDAAGTPLGVNTAFLLGRLVSISGLGAKSVFRYSPLGEGTGVGTRMTKPGAPSSTLSSRYAPRWYVKTTELDAIGRPLKATTGVTVPQLRVGGLSELEFTYSKRGVMTSIGGSYGTLLAGVSYTSDGLVDAVTLGDAAGTQRSFQYDVKRRIHYVHTDRSAAPQWSSPPPGYTPPVGNQTGQLELEHYGFEYDDIDTGAPENGPGNIWKIRDYRSDADWPASARPVTREFRFDDLYRVTQAKYTPANGLASDPWTSPYAAEVADATRVPQPSPHVSFVNRVKQQDFIYDWLGNIQRTTDNESGFWDRSIGNTTRGTATNDPNQMRSATNRVIASTSPRKGDLSLASDVTGNYTDLVVRRDGPCLPGTASCWQRFKYEWNEVGELVKAQRWDLTVPERTANDATTEPVPPRPPNAELRYTYEGSERTLKTAVDAAGLQLHTVYIFGGLELRSTEWNTTASPLDFDLDPEKVQLRLPAGIATARVLYSEESLPTLTSGKQHVFLELKDQIGSGTFIIDKETGELVEAATYHAYGAPDSDYRPSRWESYREPNKFSGKEDDIELGLVYFGARYYAANLGTWMSPDPVTIHEAGSTANPYEYVGGAPIMAVDPDGREPITLGIVITAVIVGAVVGAGTSIVIQAANNGWSNIDWGLKGVAGAALTGAVTGAVTCGIGGALGGSLSGALGSVGGGLTTGALAGATAGAAGYVTSSLAAGQRLSWSGLGKAMAIGGAAGLVGAAGGMGGSAVGGRGIGGDVLGSVGGTVGGGAGGAGTQLMFGDQIDPMTVALSAGIGLAAGMAQVGVKMAGGDEARAKGEPLPPSDDIGAQIDRMIQDSGAAPQNSFDGSHADGNIRGLPYRRSILDSGMARSLQPYFKGTSVDPAKTYILEVKGMDPKVNALMLGVADNGYAVIAIQPYRYSPQAEVGSYAYAKSVSIVGHELAHVAQQNTIPGFRPAYDALHTVHGSGPTNHYEWYPRVVEQTIFNDSYR